MFSFWIRKRIFSLITFLLKPIIKFEIEFEDGVSDELIKEAETVYAVPTNSVTDLVALHLLTESLNIFRPLSKISNSNLNRFTCLKAPVFSQKHQKIMRQASYNLESIIELDEGWNLIANPLVLLTAKSEISVEYDDVTLSWEDAVNAGWIAPSINGWFGDSHFPYEVLHPAGGYWVNTSRDLSLHFTTDDGSSGILAREVVDNSWNMKLNASALDGESFGDYLIVGLADNADSEFKYGEDEYDMPNPMNSSVIDMHIDNIEWDG